MNELRLFLLLKMEKFYFVLSKIQVIQFIVIFFTVLNSNNLFSSDYTSKLAKSGLVKIEVNQCKDYESKIGQLLYATVYFGDETGKAIYGPTEHYNMETEKVENKKYIDMVKDLNLGGVLPHYSLSYKLELEKLVFKEMFDLNQKLKDTASFPLFVGVDYIRSCGLGFGNGVLYKAPQECKRQYFKLQAACHAQFGINHALGPTIEHSERNSYSLNLDQLQKDATSLIDEFNQAGIVTSLKHYPYTPDDYNLHRQSSDTKLSKDLVERKLKNFSVLSDKADFAMSTHLYNSSVDPSDMATFSKKWVSYLRDYAGFTGILMTDALFMITRYKENMIAMSMKLDQSKWRKKIDDETVFAIRAILAGHDMVFLDGNYIKTKKTFEELLYVACSDTKYSQEFRNRINQSYKKITKYKKANALALNQKHILNADFLAKADAAINRADHLIFPDMCTKIDEALALLQPSNYTALKKYNFTAETNCKECSEIKVDTTSTQMNQFIDKVDQILKSNK